MRLAVFFFDGAALGLVFVGFEQGRDVIGQIVDQRLHRGSKGMRHAWRQAHHVGFVLLLEIVHVDPVVGGRTFGRLGLQQMVDGGVTARALGPQNIEVESLVPDLCCQTDCVQRPVLTQKALERCKRLRCFKPKTVRLDHRAQVFSGQARLGLFGL